MDFTFTDQQLAFRDAIRKFLVVEAAPEMLREIWETQIGRSAELRAKLADQGLTDVPVRVSVTCTPYPQSCHSGTSVITVRISERKSTCSAVISAPSPVVSRSDRSTAAFMPPVMSRRSVTCQVTLASTR